MTGQVEFNTELFNNETTGVMKLSDDSNKHTIFTGGTYIPSQCLYYYVSVLCSYVVISAKLGLGKAYRKL